MEPEPTQQAQSRERVAKPLKRVLRVLEYTGTDEWLTETLNRRAIKGTVVYSGFGIIREAVIGEIAHYLDHAENVQRIFAAKPTPAPPEDTTPK